MTCWGCRQDQRAVVLPHLAGVAIASMLSMSSASGVSPRGTSVTPNSYVTVAFSGTSVTVLKTLAHEGQ